MASFGLEHSRLPTEEGQPFVTVSNQEYQTPALSFNNNNYRPPAFNATRQVVLQPPTRGNNCFSEFDSSRQEPLQQRVISYIDRSISRSRRKNNDVSDTLRRIFCWVVSNILLTCGVVIGLLFLLKFVNSPLLRCEGRNNFAEALLIQGNDQKACVPCPANHRNDDNPSKLPICCAVNQKALQELIEKITKETIRAQLPETPHQRNISGGHQVSAAAAAAGQGPCGALFFLDSDQKKDAAMTQTDSYTVLRGWSTIGNVAYKHSCIAYDDSTGKVTISQSGVYLVYSHLAFIWEASKDSNSPPSTIMGQEIRVEMSNGNPTKEPIAKDTRAIQQTNPLVGYIPSYNSRTMTIVNLQSGTQLTVVAKPPHLVIRNNAVSSFGLYRL